MAVPAPTPGPPPAGPFSGPGQAAVGRVMFVVVAAVAMVTCVWLLGAIVERIIWAAIVGEYTRSRKVREGG